MNTLAIIQARMGSTRLPGKVLMKLEGVSILSHLIRRLRRCSLIDELVLATSEQPENDPLVDLAEREQVRFFRGSEDYVLDRYYQVAKINQPQRVVRVTADCPAIDSGVVDKVIERHRVSGADYVSNTVTRSYPIGCDVEVFSFEALEKAAAEALKPYEREHVTPYIFTNPNLFSIEQVQATASEYSPNLRCCVDTAADFEFLSEIFKRLYGKDHFFSVDPILLASEK